MRILPIIAILLIHNNYYFPEVAVKIRNLFPVITALLIFSSGQLRAADLIMTAPPRESLKDAQEMYGPVAAHLSKLLGLKVVYQYPKDWLTFSKHMREGKYDVVFDGPHFISWRAVHLQHTPVVRLPGSLEFYIIAKAADKTVNSTGDLFGKKICGLAPPNLGTLSVYAEFPNPVRQPIIHEVKGGMQKVFLDFKEGKCDAAVLRTSVFDKGLKPEDKAFSKVIYKSPAMPNQGISVSPKFNQAQIQQIITSLTVGDGVASTTRILKRFGGKAKAFIPVKPDEFTDLNLLMEGVVWGW